MKGALYTLTGIKFVENMSIPKYSPSQLLIKVKAAAINPVDYKVNVSRIPFIRWFIPETVGRDFSGIVLATGLNVKNFKVGDEVFGNAYGGSLQEYTIVKENDIALKP